MNDHSFSQIMTKIIFEYSTILLLHGDSFLEYQTRARERIECILCIEFVICPVITILFSICDKNKIIVIVTKENDFPNMGCVKTQPVKYKIAIEINRKRVIAQILLLQDNFE